MRTMKWIALVLAFSLLAGGFGFAAYAYAAEDAQVGFETELLSDAEDLSAEQTDAPDIKEIKEEPSTDASNEEPETTLPKDGEETNEAENEAENETENETENGTEPSAKTDARTERTVTVTASYDTDTLRLGSRITLTAHLKGYDGVAYTCRWQCAPADSEGNIVGKWKDVQDGGLTLEYTLTEDNMLTAWRVCVTAAE